MQGQHRLDVMEMKWLKRTCGVSWCDRVKIEKLGHRARVKGNMNNRLDRKASKCFFYVRHISAVGLTDRVFVSDDEGKKKSRHCLR